MKYHPLADIFPLIDGSDYDALVADIKANGLLEPIWIYEDKILDGRNRWRACKDAKIEPKTREYKGKDALGFIVSLNLKRRHLNESQRGMVGARLLAILKEKNDNGIKVLASTERWDRERELKEISESDLPYDVKHEQMGNLKERWNKKDRTSINESSRVIYLMSDGDRMKVGVTSQVEIRLKSLKTSIPNLKLEKTWPGGFLEEKDLHKELKSFSCGGEWYSKTNESLAIVNWYMQTRKNADVHIPILKTASKIMNVGGRSIESAKQVIERGTPELVKAVDSGRMPVSVAERLTKATPQKQREVAKEYETKATATELKAHVALATGENEWYTPPEYIAAARKVMGGIDCDPASSEKANKTVRADTFFTQENDGLSQKWTKNEWINPCVCSCGIHPHILYLSHETKAMPYLRKALFGEHKKNVPDVHANNSFARDENMHEMFKGISEHAGVFSRKATQGKVVFRLLQELLPRDSSAETGSSPERPNRTDKSVGRKATIQSKSKGNRTQENTESDSQSYSQTEKNEQGVFLESCSMGASPVRVGAQVRVLWSGNDIDTGSFYSALTSGLSGNSSMEYDSLLLEVQLTKGINSSERLVGFGAICPHCGKTGVVVSSPASIFCNPPYAQPLVSHFSDAVVKKFKSGEIDEACILVNNATETTWFQNMAECSSAICFPKGRVKFLDQNGNPGAPLQGQAVLYLGKKFDVFCSVFERFGITWKR